MHDESTPTTDRKPIPKSKTLQGKETRPDQTRENREGVVNRTKKFLQYKQTQKRTAPYCPAPFATPSKYFIKLSLSLSFPNGLLGVSVPFALLAGRLPLLLTLPPLMLRTLTGLAGLCSGLLITASSFNPVVGCPGVPVLNIASSVCCCSLLTLSRRSNDCPGTGVFVFGGPYPAEDARNGECVVPGRLGGCVGGGVFLFCCWYCARGPLGVGGFCGLV